MLIEARHGIAATRAAIEAERDFWLAETNLGTALIGGNAGGSSSESTASSATPAENAGGH